jgi:hypothetical protein
MAIETPGSSTVVQVHCSRDEIQMHDDVCVLSRVTCLFGDDGMAGHGMA